MRFVCGNGNVVGYVGSKLQSKVQDLIYCLNEFNFNPRMILFRYLYGIAMGMKVMVLCPKKHV